jgi:hypothetical protein
LLHEFDVSDIAAITVVRNRIRRKGWEAITARHGAIPPTPTCYGDLGFKQSAHEKEASI